MSRLEDLVTQHSITIETPRVRLPAGESVISTPFTLHLGANVLRDTKHAEHTITPIEALTMLFILVDAARTDRQLRTLSAKKKKALQQFLGPWYEPFWEAFFQDQQEQMERQRAATRASFAKVPQGEELVFTPGERVRYLGDGAGLREDSWVYCSVIDEVWKEGHFVGILVQREKDGSEVTMLPESLFKENR